jgi:hypothetical protein
MALTNASSFAVRLDSHGQNYDSAGVSIEGLFSLRSSRGNTLVNPPRTARMEGPHSLFRDILNGPGWGWEFNRQTASTYRLTDLSAYRSFRFFQLMPSYSDGVERF